MNVPSIPEPALSSSRAEPTARSRAQTAGGSLPTWMVLEEEAARLHQGPPPQPLQLSDLAFRDEHVLDPAGIVHLLEAARSRTGGQTPRSALPLPRTTALDAAAQVLRDAPALQQALDAALAASDADRATVHARLRAALAERLTTLLVVDHSRDPAFAPFLSDAAAVPHAPVRDAATALAQRNRLALERIFAPFVSTLQDLRLRAVFSDVRERRHAALCLSGGGIRSASFALGIVQGLARHGVLGRFDYLSTVSGGGYTGGFLSAWMARAGAGTVARRLAHAPTTVLGAEALPIRHIRAYSHYLNPRIGLLSVDTWTLVATMLRNLLLVWLVLLPFVAAALMVPRLVTSLTATTVAQWARAVSDSRFMLALLVTAGLALAVWAIAFVHRHLISDPEAPAHVSRGAFHADAFVLRCLLPLAGASIALTIAWELWWEINQVIVSESWWPMLAVAPDAHPTERTRVALLLLVAVGAGIHLLGWLIGAHRSRRTLREGAIIAATGGVAGAVAGITADWMFGLPPWERRPELYATFAVPLFLLMLVFGSQVFIGFTSRRMRDADREASARFNAWVLIVVAGWMTVFALALLVPVQLVEAWHRIAVLGVGGLSGIVAALIGASSSAPATPEKTAVHAEAARGIVATLKKAAMAFALPAFAASVVVLVSIGNAKLLATGCRFIPGACGTPNSDALLALARQGELFATADSALPWFTFAVLVTLLLAGWGIGRLVDTNRFSLHAMYRSRLVRTFLRASKAPFDRAPDPFTGFDETDDLPMAALWPARTAHHPPGSGDGTRPPLHVVNLTLNVVAGGSLAWQQRKAESFTVTSLHAGSPWVGYRRTSPGDGEPDDAPRYGGGSGITLGTAVAVSGAAASPEAGYHSSPVVTFLMTLFNARLGWWLGNPGTAGDATWTRDEPKLAITPILGEMFGLTTDRSPYVYLSDGGHYDNLGLYEMVLRRNRLVVVSDAGCDPNGTFEDLGGAIRKIRIDLGIPIEFDAPMTIYPRGQAPADGEGTYWAVGRIRYSAVDHDPVKHPDRDARDYDGLLLYLKPAFYGREPRDVYNYAQSRPDFPHESTSDQFFGEAQLESYRSLGSWIVDELFTDPRFGELESALRSAPGRSTLDGWLEERLAEPGVRTHTPVSVGVISTDPPRRHGGD